MVAAKASSELEDLVLCLLQHDTPIYADDIAKERQQCISAWASGAPVLGPEVDVGGADGAVGARGRIGRGGRNKRGELRRRARGG